MTDLFYRYLHNQCSADEIKELLKHFNHEEDDLILKMMILSQLKVDAPPHFEEQPEVVQVFGQTDQFLKSTLFPKTSAGSSLIKKLSWYAVAASIAIVLTTAYFFLPRNPLVENKLAGQQFASLQDAEPGTDRAILTLTDGTSVVLDENHQQDLFSDAGLMIRKAEDGTLIYETASLAVEGAELKYNQLRTPRGAQYEVLLPDGTRVWLNAASSIRYPLAFSGEERRVQLTGEAYFDVEKSVKDGQYVPFFVETPTQVVQVMGTQFNISAYDDDYSVKTTLVSGKVNVSERNGRGREILSPGEQAILIPGNNFQVIKTNTEIATAWKKGNFMYEDVYLKDILKQLSRWYDVDVDYAQVPQTRYNMLISRKETLQSVLNMLRKTGNIKFDYQDNKIRIVH